MRSGLLGRWKTFGVAAVLVAATTAAFAAVTDMRHALGNVEMYVDNLVQLGAAAAAAVACAWAAWRAGGRERTGWVLLSASAGSWAAGQAVWSVYALLLDVEIPYPSIGDVGFLAAIPFAIAGILCFWTAPRDTAVRWRIWLDGAIIALTLLFTVWGFGLNVVFEDQDSSALLKALNLAYPLGDIVIGTVLILGIRRATRQQRGRMLLLLVGLGANSVSDTAFSLLSATNNYSAGDILDSGWVLGYLLVALSAIWPVRQASVREETVPIDVWQLALPWTAIALASVTGLMRVLSGRPLDLFLSLDTALIGVLLMASQVQAHLDSRRMLLKARTSEKALAEVVTHAPASVVRLSSDLRVVDANPRFVALTLGGDGDVRGRVITDCLQFSDAKAFTSTLDTLREDPEATVEGDGEVKQPGGRTIWIHWSATAVPNALGAPESFIAMFEDMTARHEAEAAAAASLELMQRLNTLKTEFLQSVSHEFKTALIGIQGFSEFMRDADQLDVNDARAFAADINRDAERLDRMVGEMIALDTVESTRASMRMTAVDINSLIEHEVAGAQFKTSATITTQLAEPAPRVSGDEEKLGDVVRTLLANASRYSPEAGHITVMTSLSGKTVTVSVADEGVAARADFDNRLFGQDDLYANNPIRKVVGTGLGLGIVRQVVEMHGGRVWVDRIDGKGSVFHFTLQVAADAPARGAMVA